MCVLRRAAKYALWITLLLLFTNIHVFFLELRMIPVHSLWLTLPRRFVLASDTEQMSCASLLWRCSRICECFLWVRSHLHCCILWNSIWRGFHEARYQGKGYESEPSSNKYMQRVRNKPALFLVNWHWGCLLLQAKIPSWLTQAEKKIAVFIFGPVFLNTHEILLYWLLRQLTTQIQFGLCYRTCLLEHDEITKKTLSRI